ncbi:hypothetical protein WR25_02530 [Diploscapter pachys]|uniref:Uncharacterized protein n=1 Tax=Diploscapter pachys TaxID=2018661 RepID=A0A2A2K9U5_9BILA|nr:hypothetical protein WR25_02530 [Diploscapter pachys]
MTADAEMVATTTKASEKHRCGGADAERQRQLLKGRVEAGRRAHLRLVEARNAKHQHDRGGRPIGAEQRAGRIAEAAGDPRHDQAAAKAPTTQHARGERLHRQRADRARHGDRTGLRCGEAEAELQHQRQQERLCPLCDPRQRPGDHRQAEGRHPHQRGVEDRIGHVTGVAEIGDAHAEARDQQDQGDQPGAGAARQLEAEQKAAERHARQDETDQIETGARIAAHLRHQQQRTDDAHHAEGDVEVENPAPVEPGDDDAADRWPQDRAGERGHDQPGQGLNHVFLGDAAQQDEAADRHHHRTADPLDEAGGDQRRQRPGLRAGDRTEQEHDDRPAEDAARAEAVGQRAACRDEQGERQQIAGEREAEAGGGRAEIAGHGGQGDGQHGPVELLHEQRGGDDQRDDAIAAGGSGRSALAAGDGFDCGRQTIADIGAHRSEVTSSPPHVVRSCSFARRGGMRRPASIVILTRFDGGVPSGVCARREPCRVVHGTTVCGST